MQSANSLAHQSRPVDSNELFGIEAILQVLNRLPQDVHSVSRVDNNILVGGLDPKDSIYRNHQTLQTLMAADE